MILLGNGKVIEIQNIYCEADEILINGVQWQIKQPIYYDDILNSYRQKSYELKRNSLPEIITISLEEIENKLVRFELNFSEDGDKRIFVILLLHE